MSTEIRQGHVLDRLRDLPAESVQCCVTSPPYLGLRNYQTDPVVWGGEAGCAHEWGPEMKGGEGYQGGNKRKWQHGATRTKEPEKWAKVTGQGFFCQQCGAWLGHLGLEPTPELYTAHIVEIFREVRRVLRPDATLWLNLGDCYAGSWSGNSMRPDGGVQRPGKPGFQPLDERVPARSGNIPPGLKPKDLVGIPWRVAFALQADGWTLRQEIIWSKPNSMPESVKDRCTRSHEQIFMFSKARWVGQEQGRFGHIKDEDARWLALLLDTEGNICAKRAQAKDRADHFGTQICFANSCESLLNAARRIIGSGTVLTRKGKNAPMFYLQLSNIQAAHLLYRIYPFLIVKKRQAKLAVYLQNLIADSGRERRSKIGRLRGRTRADDYTENLIHIWMSMKMLNHFKELDLTWVHEPRYGHWDSQPYFYDAGAIAEPVAEASLARISQKSFDSQTGGEKDYGPESNRSARKALENFKKRSWRGSTFDDGKTGEMKATRGGLKKSGNKARKLAGEEEDGRLNTHLGSSVPWEGSTRNKRDVWTIPTQPFPEAHFACVDAETECLTTNGWKSHDQLCVGDLAAQFDLDVQKLSWGRIETVARYDVTDQEMIVGKRRDLNMVLTPNHRCVIQRRHPKTRRWQKHCIVRADQLLPSHAVPSSAPWDFDGDASFPLEWAELLGWYVAEGHESRGSMAIEIYQSESANPQKCSRIEMLLRQIGAEWTSAKAARIWRGRPATMVAYRVMGYAAVRLREAAPKKRIPAAALLWKEDRIGALLDGILGGDGHVRRDGRCSFVQKDRTQAGLVQALVLRLGLSASLSQRPDGMQTVYITKHRTRSFRGTAGHGTPLARERYTGIVWCPKLPKGTWLARRQGRCFITGNTFPVELARTCVLAGSRLGDVVLDPFLGAGTTGMMAHHLGRKFIGIELNPEYVLMARRRIAGPLFAEE